MAYKVTEEVKAALSSLAGPDGRIYPATVVKAASDPNSVLHLFFTWDNNEAGDLWREEEARKLLRIVKIEVMVEDVKVTLSGHVSTPGDRKSYTQTAVVLADEDLGRAHLLAEIKRVVDAMTRAEKFARVLKADGALADLKARAQAFMNAVKDDTTGPVGHS